ncbi:carboxypeptidase-like regulatory domain-containing protein [Acidobacterium sp. S8]|uniref:TonB-dependent receptor n=1 Tax=Acidobacterium sp. S8 TaxID=1641854 RepID=UPI00131A7C30|nr:carboxypeptidase-like regulatory domain-containing protein [Acidobacterium sp. S8]
MWKTIRGSLMVALALSGINGFAQNTNSGDIRGTVTDATGAVIPDTAVKVEDVDKGVVRTYTTDSAGLFDTGPIVPDHYLITFSRDGFQTYVRGPITLQVGIQTVNAQLTVGAASQEVIVKTDVPLLDTESGSQTSTLTSKTMAELPQVGADWQNFVILLPGTSGVQQNSSNALNPGQIAAMNGNLPYSSVLADGATTTLPMSQNSDVNVFETVSEVKISNSAFSAQYGIGGIIFNQISKGGSNQWHGVGYEYFQNDAMNANPYAFGQKSTVPFLRYNNFGGSVSGPIWRNRLFFYFNYDKTLQNGGASNGFITVPTDLMRSGDFTGQPTIYDPTTQTVDANGVVHRKSFAEEYNNGNKIPTNMVDAVAGAIQKYYPEPNATGTLTNGQVTNNYFYNTPSSNPFTKYFGRLDYDVTQNNRLTVSETNSDNPATYLNQGICPINCQHGDVSRDNAQVSDVWTFSPNFINEARMGFTDQLNFFTPYSINQGFPAKLGWQFSKADVFPDVVVSGACCYELQPASNAVYKEFVFDPSDVVTLIHGRHVLHFGGEFLISRADSTAWGNINAGKMQYNGVYTTSTQGDNANSGVAYADFLLGYTQAWSAQVTPEWGGRLKSPQLFVQDDIKLRPNLTVNAGIRFQGMTGWHEVKGNMRAFDPNVMNPATNTNGAMWYGVTHANGRDSLQASVWSTFLPRVGFAYQYRPNTVIRGGFGLYAYTWSDDTYGAGMGAAFGSSGGLTDTTNGVNPVTLLGGDGSSVSQPSGLSVNSAYLSSPTTPDAYNGQDVSYNQYHTPVPKIYQWNFGVQRELSTNMMFEIAYVGSHGYNLNFPVDVNQVPESKLSLNDTGNKPYPVFGQITGSTNNVVSNYNALQASVQRRFTSGLEFNFNYTWSHFLDEMDSSGWGSRGGWQNYQNAYVPSANYGASNFDIRNMFKGSVVYELPVGRGKPFLNNSALLDEIIGGWRTSTTIILQGGNPFPITTGGNNNSYNQSGDYTQYPNVVGNPLNVPGGRSINEWYSMSAYAQPAAGTYGDYRRNSLYGPGLTNVNLSLGKSFPIWERVSFEIRGDATNVFNHASFGQPNGVFGPGQASTITTVTVGGRSMQLYGRISF